MRSTGRVKPTRSNERHRTPRARSRPSLPSVFARRSGPFFSELSPQRRLPSPPRGAYAQRRARDRRSRPDPRAHHHVRALRVPPRRAPPRRLAGQSRRAGPASRPISSQPRPACLAWVATSLGHGELNDAPGTAGAVLSGRRSGAARIEPRPSAAPVSAGRALGCRLEKCLQETAESSTSGATAARAAPPAPPVTRSSYRVARDS